MQSEVLQITTTLIAHILQNNNLGEERLAVDKIGFFCPWLNICNFLLGKFALSKWKKEQAEDKQLAASQQIKQDLEEKLGR